MHGQFNYTPDPETEALKLSPEPDEVLTVMEEVAKGENEERGNQKVIGVTEEVGDVKSDVRQVGHKVDEIHSDVKELSDDFQK